MERCDDYRRKQSINVNQPELSIVIHGYREALCWLHHSYKFFLCDSVYILYRQHKFPEVSQHKAKKYFGNKYLSFLYLSQ